MRLYKRFETKREADLFEKKKKKEDRLAMKSKIKKGNRVCYEVVFFVSAEDKH